MTELASITEDPGLEALLAAASALAGGAVITVAEAPARDGRSRPLLLDERTVGHVHFDAAVPDELAALVCASLEMTLRGAQQHASRARAAQELAIGRDIQRSLLPRRFPEIEGWRFAADYEPAREVGGDLYDVFRVRGSGAEVALLIADVTGKGVPAALLMADTKALLHAAADNADDPADAMTRVNRILTLERRSSLFVTAALAEVDASTGVLRLASAGHEPPLLVGEGGKVEQIRAGGPILGAFAGAKYDLGDCRVAAGESVVLYTDGITDTRDEGGAFYGERRLLALLADLGGLEPDDLQAAVLDDVRSFRGEAEVFDDLTILVARREA
ncbi:MAG: PP2C family protein-serine/threonine phosphatase [Nocardioides sp.]